MKLLFSSDLHGLDRAYLEFAAELKRGEYSLGVLGGDLMTYPSRSEIAEARIEFQIKAENHADRKRPELYIIDFALQKKQNYYKRILIESGKPIVFVMGNDDGIIGSGKEWTCENNIQGVSQRRIDFGKYNLVGYHYTNPFVGGTFEKSEKEQNNDFKELEKLIDKNTILITHGPAWGILDSPGAGELAGSRALRELIERREPRLHIFGHVHSNFGVKNHAVNDSYPHSHQFVGIDVDAMEISFL